MPSCCSTFGGAAERQFGKKKAAQELASYREHGAGQTTSMLRDGLSQAGQFDGSLLDIGCGIGALTFELHGLGLRPAIGVDASTAYLDAAREEAARRSVDGVTQFVHGDFLLVSNSLPTAAVVTMDRVICCYPFFEPLLNEALAHAALLRVFLSARLLVRSPGQGSGKWRPQARLQSISHVCTSRFFNGSVDSPNRLPTFEPAHHVGLGG